MLLRYGDPRASDKRQQLEDVKAKKFRELEGGRGQPDKNDREATKDGYRK